MTRRKLKKPVLYAIYAVSIIFCIGLIYLIERSISNSLFKPDKDDFEYVSDTVVEDDVPVVNVKDTIIRPYTDSEIQILKAFYNFKGEAAEQEKSLIYYSEQYLQNTGVAYGGKDSFDVVAILDGTVIDVKEDNLLGKVVEIRHTNDLVSLYQSLGEVFVKKDDVINQGSIIGKSGVSNISKELNNHLHFEIIYKGQNINPEECYDKKLSDL